VKKSLTQLSIGLGLSAYVVMRVVPAMRPALILLALVASAIRSGTSSDSVESDGTFPLLVVAVALIGVTPILGWVHGASGVIDPLALVAGIAIALQISRVTKQSRPAWELFPIAGTLGFCLWWWRSFVSDSSQVGAMSRALAGWDHFGHFYLFIMNLRHDGFNMWLSTPKLGTTWYDMKYPSGIHTAWTQWWRLNIADVVAHPTHALYPYLRANLVTFAVVSAVIVLCIARIGRTHVAQFAAGIIAVGAVLGFVVWGPMSMSLWMGFPNFGVAIMGAAIAFSILIRPDARNDMNFVLVAGALCICTYNWYPSAIAVSPVALYFAWTWWRSTTSGRWRVYSGVAVAAAVVVAPVLMTLTIGVDHIQVDGGIDYLSPHLITLAAFGGIAIGLWRFLSRTTLQSFVVASVFILLGSFQLVVAVIVRRNTGHYPYYVQKIGYVTVGVVFMGVVMLLAERMFALQGMTSEAPTSLRRLMGAKNVAGALLVGLALTQVFGYVGPDWSTVAPNGTLFGARSVNELSHQALTLRGEATYLVSLSNAAASEPFDMRDCLTLIDPSLDPPALQLANSWVGVLTWSLTEQRIIRFTGDRLLIHVTADSVQMAKNFRKYRKPNTTCPVVFGDVASQLQGLGPHWAKDVWVISPDGSVARA